MKQDNKYSAVEEQIDVLLSDGRLHLFPPGTWTFVSVIMLLIFGMAALTVTASLVLFPNQIPEGAVFECVASVVLTLTMSIPAGMVARGYRKASGVLKYIVIIIAISLALFGTLSEFTVGKLIFIGLGLGSLLFSLRLLKSPSFIMYSLIAARRRELALEDIAKRKQF